MCSRQRATEPRGKEAFVIISIKQDGVPFIFAVEGRLDSDSSPQLDAYAADLSDRGVNDIIVDMAKCTYVSSAGLRVTVSMQKRATLNGSLVFRNVTPDVKDVFEMTGFDKILTIE